MANLTYASPSSISFDRVYELRDGTGIGVGAPQFGARRGVFLALTKGALMQLHRVAASEAIRQIFRIAFALSQQGSRPALESLQLLSENQYATLPGGGLDIVLHCFGNLRRMS